ncbi:hypothetical protein [Chryseobacterium sp.]|uniref:hypothetical protein n=1 Tax=Chryseobacterium sp. TaxID=1871047 RepID=UPI0012A97549|nr:hypothetical protein [Chryseobacterium sp.]QFG52033.1 hypothetical protein F7R58_00090 [Chryseobacterium sp.]
MKKLTKEEIEKQDSYAVASIIDYWKEYQQDSVIIAYITLLQRNEVSLIEGRKLKFDKFSTHYGGESIKILTEYLNENPDLKDSNIITTAESIFNKKVFRYEFETLGILTKFLGYLIGLVLILTLLTIAGPVGVIVGLIIYTLGWKFSKIGFLIYDSYKELISEQITYIQFQNRWRRSLAVTLALTIFFSLLLVFVSHIDKAFTDGLTAVYILVMVLLAFIPQYLLLNRLYKKFFRNPIGNDLQL